LPFLGIREDGYIGERKMLVVPDGIQNNIANKNNTTYSKAASYAVSGVISIHPK